MIIGNPSKKEPTIKYPQKVCNKDHSPFQKDFKPSLKLLDFLFEDFCIFTKIVGLGAPQLGQTFANVEIFLLHSLQGEYYCDE